MRVPACWQDVIKRCDGVDIAVGIGPFGDVRICQKAVPVAPSRTSATLVTFTPGARTNWHTHKTRQILVATQGTGMVQVRGMPAQLLRAGDVAEVPPGVVHWHGAVVGHLFAHISFIENDGADTTTWMEAVEEGEYRGVAGVCG